MTLRVRSIRLRRLGTIAAFAVLGALGGGVASYAQATVLRGPEIRKTKIRTPFSEGLLLTELPPVSPEERSCSVTSWNPTVADVEQAERYLRPKLLARFGAFHLDSMVELRTAKRHYLGVQYAGRDALLIVGFRPGGAFVTTGQWARPSLVTALPGNGDFVATNLLFMAWLPRDSDGLRLARLWPEGRALEYEAVTKLLPALQSALLRVAERAAHRKLRFKSYTCQVPNYEFPVNSASQLTETAFYTCQIARPTGGLPRDGLDVRATGTIVRSGGTWRLSGTSVETHLVGLR